MRLSIKHEANCTSARTTSTYAYCDKRCSIDQLNLAVDCLSWLLLDLSSCADTLLFGFIYHWGSMLTALRLPLWRNVKMVCFSLLFFHVLFTFYLHFILFLQVVQLDPVIDDDLELQKYSKVTWKQHILWFIHLFIHLYSRAGRCISYS